MPARRAQQRGQATVEHVGVVVLVLTLLLVVTSVTVRSLHPSASPPDLVGRIADRLTAPLVGRSSTPVAPDAGAPVWPRPADEPLQPIWIALDLHPSEQPIGRWLRAVKDAVVEHAWPMAKGCLWNVFSPFSLKEAQVSAGAPVRSEMARGGGRLPGRVAKFLLKRPAVASCLAGAAGTLLP
jgi:hypothetical protein